MSIYQHREDGYFIYANFKDGVYTIVPPGGGWAKEVTQDELDLTYVPAEEEWAEHIKRFWPTTFELDDGPKFKGYRNAQNWNGWAIPYLPHEAIVELAVWFDSFTGDTREYFPKIRFGEDSIIFRWDDESILSWNLPEEEHEFALEPKVISVEEVGEVVVYEMGLGWTWYDASQSEEEEE
jgi:hypothetical protein